MKIKEDYKYLNMDYSPILVFVYNRLEHTKRLIESVKKNSLSEFSPLIIYSDAAKTEDNRDMVNNIREYIRNIKGFKSLTIIERESNYGLAANIIDGVSTQIKKYGRVIVLEDDLITAPYFLKFMNEALDMYKDDERVGHIQAYDFTDEKSLPSTFLIKWTGSWGWATWERAWNFFNPDGTYLLHELEKKNLTKEFDFNGKYGYTRMLRRQIAGKNNSWAIRWNASLFLNNILSLNVGRSLVQNTGFDGSGTHCGSDNLYSAKLYENELLFTKIRPIEENKKARKAYEKYYSRTNSLFAKGMRRLRRIWKGLFR